MGKTYKKSKGSQEIRRIIRKQKSYENPEEDHEEQGYN